MQKQLLVLSRDAAAHLEPRPSRARNLFGNNPPWILTQQLRRKTKWPCWLGGKGGWGVVPVRLYYLFITEEFGERWSGFRRHINNGGGAPRGDWHGSTACISGTQLDAGVTGRGHKSRLGKDSICLGLPATRPALDSRGDTPSPAAVPHAVCTICYRWLNQHGPWGGGGTSEGSCPGPRWGKGTKWRNNSNCILCFESSGLTNDKVFK